MPKKICIPGSDVGKSDGVFGYCIISIKHKDCYEDQNVAGKGVRSDQEGPYADWMEFWKGESVVADSHFSTKEED